MWGASRSVVNHFELREVLIETLKIEKTFFNGTIFISFLN